MQGGPEERAHSAETVVWRNVGGPSRTSPCKHLKSAKHRYINEELAEMACNAGHTVCPDQCGKQAHLACAWRVPVLVMKDKRDTEADLLLIPVSPPRPKIIRSSHNSHMLVGPRKTTAIHVWTDLEGTGSKVMPRTAQDLSWCHSDQRSTAWSENDERP